MLKTRLTGTRLDNKNTKKTKQKMRRKNRFRKQLFLKLKYSIMFVYSPEEATETCH